MRQKEVVFLHKEDKKQVWIVKSQRYSVWIINWDGETKLAARTDTEEQARIFADGVATGWIYRCPSEWREGH